MFRSGFVTIIGRPNVGKSTFINSIVGEKVAIVSNKPQTTRNCIKGVYTNEDYQIIFIDTPGIHKPRTRLGEYMMSSVKTAQDDVDCIVMMLDSKLGITKQDEELLASLEDSSTPVVIALNKTDLTENVEIFFLTEKLKKEYPKLEKVIPISAEKGKGVQELLDIIASYMPEGPMYYQEEFYTDQSERFMISEIIREKTLNLLREEIPHGIGVEIEKIKKKKDGPTSINAVIICEKKSHKGIVIGKNGAMLKEIGTQARIDIEKLVDNKVYLELWVKIRDEWRNDSAVLKDLGYSE